MELDDNILTIGGVYFGDAVAVMISDNVSRPSGDLSSLTDIGSTVTLYLKGLNVARAALADAARTGGDSVSTLMKDSTELDSFLAQSIGTGFALPGGPE